MNEWIEQYKQYHAEQNTNYPGNNLKPQLHHIKDLVLDTKAETLLDYGCGKGLQYTKWKHHEDLGIMPALYDPAVPEYENLPDGPFHGVFSTDVLEHIPEHQIPKTIEEITRRAERFVFVAICNSPAIAILPNGEIIPLMPVLAERTTYFLCSIALNLEYAKCCLYPAVFFHHPSFVITHNKLEGLKEDISPNTDS